MPFFLQLEAIVDTHSEPTPELKDKVKSMAKDKLHMEKLIAKLYSVSSKPFLLIWELTLHQIEVP